MATEFVIIDDSHLTKAKQIAAYGETPDGKIYIFTDKKRTGLQLRVQGRKASWLVKYKGSTKTIGYLSPSNHLQSIVALSRVRDIAEVCLAYLKNSSGHKLERFLSAYFEKHLSFDGTHTALLKSCMTEVDEKIDEITKKSKHLKSWSFRQCIDKTIEEKSKSDSRKRIKSATVKDYLSTFNKTAFSRLLDKPVTEIEAADIEAVRDQVKLASGISSAIKVITYSRAVLDYCCMNHSASGLDKSRPWWRMLSAPWVIQPKEREPSIEDIVKSLILAERYLDAPLPGRAINTPGVKKKTLGGLWWIVLTCQRVRAGLSLQPFDIIDDVNDNDFKIAFWAADIMKTGRIHALPIPANGWEKIQEYVGPPSELLKQKWVFPSDLTREKPVSSSGVYRILYRLAARDEFIQPRLERAAESRSEEMIQNGQKPRKNNIRTERKDLLEENGISWWSPHDLRRALTSVLGINEIPGGASLIMAHEIDTKETLRVSMSERQQEDFLKNRTAKITRFAYGSALHLNVKKQAMQIWCDTILEEYYRQKSAGYCKKSITQT